MNATRNTKKNKALIQEFRREYVSRRGTDQLRTELTEHFGSTGEGATITSVLQPPIAIEALGSLPEPGRWFQSLVDKSHVRASDLPAHPKDDHITGYHATGVIHASSIIQQGYVADDLGQSAAYEGIA